MLLQEEANPLAADAGEELSGEDSGLEENSESTPISTPTESKPANGRPRALSAPATTMLAANLGQNNEFGPAPPYMFPGGGLIGGAGAPEPGSTMRNGMATTVPQSMVSHDLQCSHTPRRGRLRQLSQSLKNRESFEMRCCKINVFLVSMQFCLGVGITALGFYMRTLTPTLKLRECPFWAGIPLLVAGVSGIYFCATDFAAYAGSVKAFLIKAICFVLSGACIFLCMIASVFPGMHGHRISSYGRCDLNVTTCSCFHDDSPNARVYLYQEINNCDMVITSVKDYLILQCALNAIASGVCLWFVTLLWKSRYQDFHSGLRFYSYSASVPPHPWSDPSNPPYFNNGGSQAQSNSPLTVRKLSQRRSRTTLASSQNLQPDDDGNGDGNALRDVTCSEC